MNQLTSGSIANYFITAPAYLSKFSNAQWNYILSRRFGRTIIDEPLRCPFCKSKTKLMDIHGHHASVCESGGHRIHRHNVIRDAISQLCKDGNIRHRIEPQRLTKSNKRPADVLIYGVERTGIALDVGITDAVSRYCTDKIKHGNGISKQDVTVSNTDVLVPSGHYAGKYSYLLLIKSILNFFKFSRDHTTDLN